VTASTPEQLQPYATAKPTLQAPLRNGDDRPGR
jgi:hypothetical protein